MEKSPRLVVDFTGSWGSGKEQMARDLASQLRALGASVRLEVKVRPETEQIDLDGPSNADFVIRTRWPSPAGE